MCSTVVKHPVDEMLRPGDQPGSATGVFSGFWRFVWREAEVSAQLLKDPVRRFELSGPD